MSLQTGGSAFDDDPFASPLQVDHDPFNAPMIGPMNKPGVDETSTNPFHSNYSQPGGAMSAGLGLDVYNNPALQSYFTDTESKNWGGASVGAESPMEHDAFNVSDDEGKHNSVSQYSSSYGKVSTIDEDDQKEGCSWVKLSDVNKGAQCKVTCSYSQIKESIKKRIQLGAGGYLEKVTEDDITAFRSKEVEITDYDLAYEIAEIEIRVGRPGVADIFEDEQDIKGLDDEYKIWLPWACLIPDETEGYEFMASVD